MTSSTKPVGVALVGVGRISGAHLDAVAALPQLGRIVAIADTDLSRARAAASRYGVDRALDSLEAALALEAVDAVILCTPNEAHRDQTLAALAGGRHVLLEKPMAEHAADAELMAQAAQRSGLVLALGHSFRHGATVRHLQDHRDEFGELYALEVSHCVRWDGPQTPWWATRTPEQSLIISMFAPHALDFVQMAMGDDPLRVQAEAARRQDRWLAEDELMVVLGYPGRRMASVHISYNQPHVVHRRLLYFDRGVLRIDDGEQLYWNDELRLDESATVVRAPGRMGGRDHSSYFRTQFEEFVRAIRGLPNRSVLAPEGVRLTRLMDRVRDAALATSADAVR